MGVFITRLNGKSRLCFEKFRFFSINSFSADDIPFISPGWLRNQNQQTATQISPKRPLTKKGARHPYA
jgi:hypothetical protein